MIKVKFKKLNALAKAPVKKHDDDAAYDLTATSLEVKGDNFIYGTGITMEIPKGYAGYIYPRSSVRDKDQRLTNCVGVIDAGYRGEIKMTFRPTINPQMTLLGLIKQALRMQIKPSDFFASGPIRFYKIGDRIGQIVIRTAPKIKFVEVDELEDSERGEGGHGSTGA